MGWFGILRDVSFFSMGFLLLFYVVQACFYERKIVWLEEENERLRDALRKAGRARLRTVMEKEDSRDRRDEQGRQD